MKKKLIALLLATATFVSACGAEAEEPDEEDSETIDEEEPPKSDEAEDEDDEGDGLLGLGDVATTDTNATAVPEAQCDSTTIEKEAPKTAKDASVTIEQSDVNSNLWVITNNSTNAYYMIPHDPYSLGAIVPYDEYLAPGESIYYFAISDENGYVKDAFLFGETEIKEGDFGDIECAVVTVSYDSSKLDRGYQYILDDVWDVIEPEMKHEDNRMDKNYLKVTYFRLFDADGNVIYEPEIFSDFNCSNLYFTLTYGDIKNWDHAEFYVTYTHY